MKTPTNLFLQIFSVQSFFHLIQLDLYTMNDLICLQLLHHTHPVKIYIYNDNNNFYICKLIVINVLIYYCVTYCIKEGNKMDN